MMLATRFKAANLAATQPMQSSTPRALVLLAIALASLLSGCYAPLHSPGMSASNLPDFYRLPVRTTRPPLIWTELTKAPVTDYPLGPGDVVEVTGPVLQAGAEVVPRRYQVMPNGTLMLPKAGIIWVHGQSLSEAQNTITRAYHKAGLLDPFVSLYLLEKATVSVLVLGEVAEPGIHLLPRGENDIGHAIAAAGGMTDVAADYVEIHARGPAGPWQPPQTQAGDPSRPSGPSEIDGYSVVDPKRLRIVPLYGPGPETFSEADVTLHASDVVRVPRRSDEVFYVVGELSQINQANFTVSERQRELGSGFLLPANREIDVIEAVAMAGYIDPIQSPTTVTVHRRPPGHKTELIRVDLMKARVEPRENVMVQAGDIIYLNPDAQWWMRRTFDRVLVTTTDNILRSVLGN